MFNSVVHGLGQLLAYFYDFLPNYGVGIILLTVMVRVMMVPLAVKQAHIMEANRGNAEKMRKIQPEVKKLREKYKDDRTKLYEEQKKLYDHHEVNMLGGLSGCLPLILQMPVFYAMYSVLSGCNKIFGSGRVCELGFHVPDGTALKQAIIDDRATFLLMDLNLHPSVVLQQVGLGRALPYYLLVAVMGYTMWYQSRQMMRAQPVMDPQMAQMQKVMQFLPLIVVFASLNFPAGLTVYWTATNIWGIGQQYVLTKRIRPKAAAAAEAKERARALEKAPEKKPAKAVEGGSSNQGAPLRPKPASGSNGRPPGAGGAGGSSSGKRPAARAARPPAGGPPAAAGGGGRRKPPGAGGSGRPSAGNGAPKAAVPGVGAKSSAVGGSASGSSAGGGAANGQSGSGGATGAARPKGSGARKRSRGGHR
ncbi:MAG: YidC/Oxa1 family membrane protein insertase [Actinomycetota bacterium]